MWNKYLLFSRGFGNVGLHLKVHDKSKDQFYYITIVQVISLDIALEAIVLVMWRMNLIPMSF